MSEEFCSTTEAKYIKYLLAATDSAEFPETVTTQVKILKSLGTISCEAADALTKYLEKKYYLGVEISELSQNLTGSFEKWNKGDESLGQVDVLNSAIDFAAKNGIELVLTIPKSLAYSKAVTKPMRLEDVIEHSSATDEHSIMFEIPSEAGMNRIGHSKKLTLKAVENYRDLGAVLLLKHKTKGVIGTFMPGGISSLQPK